jgi:putative membrane protein
MKTLLPALMAALMIAGLAGPAGARRNNARNEVTPAVFIEKIGNANQFEIQSSQLALQKSHNDAIRKFAQRMIDDHTKLGDELKDTLKQANLPGPGVKLDKEPEALLAKLESLNGAAFDSTYIRDQRVGHQQAIRLLEGYVRKGSNETLKQFASKILPEIKEHERLADELRGGRSLSARR